MSWLRSAAIYLVLTIVIAGSIWLFWGKDLEKAWKKFRENPSVKEKLPKETEKAKARLPKAKDALETAQQLPVNAAAEWKKTQSGAVGLVEAQKRESTRDFQALAARHDARMIDILRTLKIYKDPKPAAPSSPEPMKAVEKKPAKKEPVKPKKEKEKKKKEPLKPML